MKVYVVAEDYGESLTIFATRELAVRYCEPAIAALWEAVMDPTVEMHHAGWGGKEWRVKHWTELGFEAFRDRELSSRVEEFEVIES